MYNNGFLTICWLVGCAAELLICALLIKKRLLRQWPSLLCFCSCSLIVDIVLVASKSNYALHFYAYWIWVGLTGILRLWVLADVVRSFPGAELISQRVRHAIFLAAAVIALGSAALAGLDVQSHLAPIISAVTLLNSAAAYAWAGFLLTVLGAVSISRLGWARQGAVVVVGLTIQIASSMLAGYLIATASPFIREVAINVRSFCNAASVLTWLYAITLNPESLEQLKTALLPTRTGHRERGVARCTH